MEAGLIYHWMDKSLEETRESRGEVFAATRRVNLRDGLGLVIVLGGCLVLAFITLICEILIKKYTQPKRVHTAYEISSNERSSDSNKKGVIKIPQV